MNTMDREEITTGKLAEAGRELPFTVPRGYFGDFPARMEALLGQETAAAGTPPFTLWTRYLKPALGLAAAFAAVFLLVYWPARLITRPGDLTGLNNGNGYDENLINLVERVDDRTFFSILQEGASGEKLETEEMEIYLAANFTDYEIYLESQKQDGGNPDARKE